MDEMTYTVTLTAKELAFRERAREAGIPAIVVSMYAEALQRLVEMAVEAALEKFKAELVEKVASNTWSFQPTKWVGLDEYTKNRFQDRIKEESMTNLEIMDLVEHFLKVSNGGLE